MQAINRWNFILWHAGYSAPIGHRVAGRAIGIAPGGPAHLSGNPN